MKNKVIKGFDRQSLPIASHYIDEIIELAKHTGRNLRVSQERAELKSFVELIDNLQLFIEFMGATYDYFLKSYSDFSTLDNEMKNIHIGLHSLLKCIFEAKERGDYVMLCDLIEYELVDNLSRWKISIIPELKACLNRSSSSSRVHLKT